MSDTRPDTNAELAKLKYSHIEAMVVLGIVAVIVITGFICMVKRIDGGQMIFGSGVTIVMGWIGAKKFGNRSARS
jgi:hypothetical protein